MSHLNHDFIAETKGRCFICSSNVSNPYHSTDLNSSISSSIYSLHCLAQYLRLDMRKVFTGSGPIPPQLVDRVKKSRLKVELCDECVVLSEKFSNLFRQMERVEMEATSLLETIRGKLERAAKLDDPDMSKSFEDNSKDEWMAKLEITEALRQDVMQKCSRKLGTIRPFPKLKRLTKKQVNEEKLKFESMEASPKSCPHFESNYEDGEDIRSQTSIANEDENDDQDEHDQSTHLSMLVDGSYVSEQEIARHEVLGRALVSYGIGLNIETEQVSEQPHRSSRTTDLTEVQQLSKAIQPPVIIKGGTGMTEKPEVGKNVETGKYKCLICSREYDHERSCQRHYKSSHLKVRFKCGICKRDFPYKQDYEKHYLSIHMGVRFKCALTFARENGLKRHQKKAHL